MRTFVTQSRMASLMASLSVCWPAFTGTTYDQVAELTLLFAGDKTLFDARTYASNYNGAEVPENSMYKTLPGFALCAPYVKVTKLPDGKILAPGVVTHSTPLLEHPQLVADRIERFAKLVGRENVIASTDCGLGLRCHPQVAWAKLRALKSGAELASAALWP